MKKFSLILGLVLFVSCKSTKPGCDSYGETRSIKTDSMIVNIEHYHLDEENYCFYKIDTIHLTK